MKTKITFDDIQEKTPPEKPLEAARIDKQSRTGRPMIDKSKKLDKKISCYFTESERERIDEARNGTPAATFVRNLVLEHLKS